MGLLEWLKGRGTSRRQDHGLTEWRALWRAAADASDTAQAAMLRASLDALNLPADEIEIEHEMLDALRDLGELTGSVRDTGLPAIQTGHRVVGSERCHFTAPASMPDDDSQPSGRLLLTSGRAIFAGGGSGTAIPWHSVGEVRHLDRDVLVIRKDRERLYRFRCNTFSDALRAAFLARELMVASRRGRL
jgi:hypothetical protein